MGQVESGGVLVVDDDQYLLAAIGQTLVLAGYKADLECSSLQAVDKLMDGSAASCLAVVADIRMPHLDGMQLLEKVKSLDPDLPVILITGHGDIALAVKAIHEGAYDFLEKPVDDEVLLRSLHRAVEKRRLVLENRKLQADLTRNSRQTFFHGLVGSHSSMQGLYGLIERVAMELDPVLISGETGTGKELVAQAIHHISRPKEKFVGLNVAALPAETMEAELFGHERGSFTGAVSSRTGMFEYAGAGTIFLDEICSLDLSLQAKLLRVLEERQFTRLGSNSLRPLEARIISATNRDLEKEVEDGRFRRDLYYRINVLNIDIPPLRERMNDLPLLVEFFRQEYCREREQQIPPFGVQLLDGMSRKTWPGNIRELRSHVRRLCIMGRDNPNDNGSAAEIGTAEKRVTLREYGEVKEREYIVATLKECNGRVGLAHQILGLSRKGLYDKVNKYDIDLARIREQLAEANTEDK